MLCHFKSFDHYPRNSIVEGLRIIPNNDDSHISEEDFALVGEIIFKEGKSIIG